MTVDIGPAPDDGRAHTEVGIDPQVRRVLEGADLAVATLDAEGRVLTATSAFAERWGRSASELVGLHAVGLWPERRRAEITASLVRLVESACDLEIIDTRSLDAEGKLRVMRTTLGRLNDEDGSIRSLVCALSDVTASAPTRRRTSPIELVPAAPGGESGPIDPLLAKAARRAARTGRPLAVLRCEVHLPESVDTADPVEILAGLATRLSGQLRATDALCRLDGRSFVVIAEDLGDEQDAAGVAYRLLSAAVEPLTIEGRASELGLTIGIVVADASASATRLLDVAEAALDEAREDGVGGFRIVDIRSGLAA